MTRSTSNYYTVLHFWNLVHYEIKIDRERVPAELRNEDIATNPLWNVGRDEVFHSIHHSFRYICPCLGIPRN
jgi:hypothetical protein